MDELVTRWRSEDFNLKAQYEAGVLAASAVERSPFGSRMTSPIPSMPSSPRDGVSSTQMNSFDDWNIQPAIMLSQKDQDKINRSKHRNLAIHLAKYSSSKDFNPLTITLSSIQTFVSVAESTDPHVATYSIIALSNISADPRVRGLLLEVNAILKVTNLIPIVISQKAVQALATLFYYFSCDGEIEDRIYNACSTTLQVSC